MACVHDTALLIASLPGSPIAGMRSPVSRARGSHLPRPAATGASHRTSDQGAELASCRRVILIFPQPPCDYLASEDDSSSLVKLRRRGLTLALVRAPRDHRVPANEEDLADLETDVAAPVRIYKQAFDEFNQMAPEVRAGQSVLEDDILSGVVRSLLSQFRYGDALSFIDLALKGEMFSAYQSQIRHDLRVQKEILPELVARTRGTNFPASGLKLWADLMDEVQRVQEPRGRQGLPAQDSGQD